MHKISATVSVLANIKAAVCKFCLFVAISGWKPEIAALCGIIFRAWVVLRYGSSAD